MALLSAGWATEARRRALRALVLYLNVYNVHLWHKYRVYNDLLILSIACRHINGGGGIRQRGARHIQRQPFSRVILTLMRYSCYWLVASVFPCMKAACYRCVRLHQIIDIVSAGGEAKSAAGSVKRR